MSDIKGGEGKAVLNQIPSILLAVFEIKPGEEQLTRPVFINQWDPSYWEFIGDHVDIPKHSGLLFCDPSGMPGIATTGCSDMASAQELPVHRMDWLYKKVDTQNLPIAACVRCLSGFSGISSMQ